MAQKHLLFYNVNILDRESLIKTKSWKDLKSLKILRILKPIWKK